MKLISITVAELPDRDDDPAMFDSLIKREHNLTLLSIHYIVAVWSECYFQHQKENINVSD